MKVLLIIFMVFSVFPVFAEENSTKILQNDMNELELKVDKLITSFTTYNNNQTYLLYATLALVGATIVSLIWTAKNTSLTLKIANKQLKMQYDEMVLKTKESQAKFKADLRVRPIDSYNNPRTYDGKTKHVFSFRFNIDNIGTVEADHVEVYYKAFDHPYTNLDSILSEESSIHKTKIPVTGSILPGHGKEFRFNYDDFSESKPRFVILWIEYGYDEFDNEMICHIEVRGGDNQFGEISIFTNDSIEIQRSIRNKPEKLSE